MTQLDSRPATFNESSAITEVTPTTSRVSPWLMGILYPFGRHLLLPLYFRQIEVTGLENLPTSGPVILAPTHRSRWDALLVAYATGRGVTGRDPRFMITSDECQGLQGWFVKHLGGFPVNPKHPSISTLRHAVDILQQKQMLVIFPEGNIFRDGEVHPLKPGLARLALSAESSQPELGVKILPIGISYSSPYPGWGSDACIHIGSPLEVADYSIGSTKQNAKRLMADLTNALKQLSGHKSEITSHGFAEVPNSGF